MSVIEVNDLTKDFGSGRGIYNVDFKIQKGETLGFLGPNGAGKSTTMRHLMGYIAPDSGDALIDGLTCRRNYSSILNNVGYLPGEVCIPDGLTGWEFIKMMQGLRKNEDNERRDYLIKIFDLDPSFKVKKMSIGEKRKLAIVTAFMNNPEILLLDEPTSGLDPHMQEVFINFIKEEKAAGKTILLSSHIFSEVEALCDRIVIVKEGCVVSVVDAREVKESQRKTFSITFNSIEEKNKFLEEGFEYKEVDENSSSIKVVLDKKVNNFISIITKYDIVNFEQIQLSLEDYFMHFYKSNRVFGGI